MPAGSLVRAWPDRWDSQALLLEEGATVADALSQAGVVLPGEGFVAVSINGVLAREGQLLHEADRLELLRPLLADPKENRRRRARGGR